jgi:hypothetical protein
MYANMVSNLADNMIASIKFVNNIMFGSMDAFKTSMQQAKRQSKGGIKKSINAAKIFEQISKMLGD